MKKEIRKFEIGIKGFIVDGDKLLMLEENGKLEHGNATNLWELPGGRIDVGEEGLAVSEILLREVREELGEDFKIEPGKIASTWVRKLNEDRFIFLIGLFCKYTGGDIKLSDEHLSYKWIKESESKDLRMADGYQSAIENFWKNLN